MMRAVGAAIACLVVTGCASFKHRDYAWPWPADQDICATVPCTDKDALDAYLQAHIFCRSVHNHYESGGNRSGAAQLAIGTVGSLAGAVISPLSSGDAAKAWAGLSGATNALQTSVKENFSGSIAANRTKAVADATVAGEGSFSKAPTSTAKVLTAIDMATACSMAPARADGEAIKALAR